MKNKFWRIVLWILILIGLFYSLCSCGSLQDAARLKRIQKRSPFLFNAQKDTITVKDTLYITIPGIKTDTLVLRSKDTIFLHKEHLTVKVLEKDSTIYIYGSCDTIYKDVVRTIRVPYTKYEVEKPKGNTMYLPFIVLAASICFFLYQMWRYYQRK